MRKEAKATMELMEHRICHITGNGRHDAPDDCIKSDISKFSGIYLGGLRRRVWWVLSMNGAVVVFISVISIRSHRCLHSYYC
jgi:hypothetical protein